MEYYSGLDYSLPFSLKFPMNKPLVGPERFLPPLRLVMSLLTRGKETSGNNKHAHSFSVAAQTRKERETLCQRKSNGETLFLVDILLSGCNKVEAYCTQMD